MLKALVAGLIFGAILQAARIDNFDKVAKFTALRDLTVLRFLLVAVGVGLMVLMPLIVFGFASFHIKPLLLVGIVVGGILFGIGMAILGYCPGTAIIALGNGSLDALIGLIGGLTAGALFTLAYPYLKDFLGPLLDKPHIYLSTPWANIVLALVVGSVLVALAWALREPRQQGDKTGKTS